MARKSRKSKDLAAKAAPQVIYRAGLYARLSVDKGEESRDSIANQLSLMEEYIKNKADITLCERYIDIGQSGTNFARGGFHRLLDDIRKGQINCVVVKDLSRFGRNHIETGSYLEEVFPLLGVRFIAVTDQYDSLDRGQDHQELLLPLRNIVNELYARDISLKVVSQLRVKQAKGEYLGSFAPYGYLRDQQVPNRLIPDPITAKVVGEIFTLRIKGISCQRIANLLTERGTPPPSRYRRGLVEQESKADVSGIWHKSTVKRILTNPVYLGDMVQCKEQSSVFWGKRRKCLPPQQWLRVKGTHPALVSQEEFDGVQASFGAEEVPANDATVG